MILLDADVLNYLDCPSGNFRRAALHGVAGRSKESKRGGIAYISASELVAGQAVRRGVRRLHGRSGLLDLLCSHAPDLRQRPPYADKFVDNK